jgi:hypothetical protein
MAEGVGRRVVEESLGEAVVLGIDAFVFRDIEDEQTATSVFEFVEDVAARARLGTALRGVRWQQKVRLVMARSPEHPAHRVLIRSEVIEYGAIVELLLLEAVRRERPTSLPKTFQATIARAAELEVLDAPAVAAADRRRQGRNVVHLTAGEAALGSADSAAALRDLVRVVNSCRARAGLAPWTPVRAASRSDART